jgi:hypothetical protein
MNIILITVKPFIAVRPAPLFILNTPVKPQKQVMDE